MKLKKQIIRLLLLVVIGSVSHDLFSQNTPVKASRQSSFEAFSKGNYEQAYKEFKELLKTYSKDPLYKYYSGVCLVKLNRDASESESLLKQAIQSATVIKSLPSDALFYLGRAQQMGGKFSDAIGSYNSFTDQAGKKAARELSVTEFITQCKENKGKITESEVKPPATAITEKTVSAKTETKPVLPEPVLKPVVKDSAATKKLPSGFDKILDEAIEFQSKSDSISSLISEEKKQLDRLPEAEKSRLRQKISDDEKAAASFQKAADLKYSEAQAAMNPQQAKILQASVPPQKSQVVYIDTIKRSDRNVPVTNANQPLNQKTDIIEEKVNAEKKISTATPASVGVFAVFEVLSKPVTDPKEKIKIDPEIPDGLIYRLQLAVFRNPVVPSYFKGITPIYGFKVPGTDKTNYYAGMFRRSADATKALAAVKAKGFKDAFVVALNANKSVSADRAAVMEKEWGNKPFFTLLTTEQKTQTDTLPPSLAFRVEVTKSLKPLKEDVVEGIKKMAGNRGLDIQILDDGNIAYLIGKFITFESAVEYADLLIKNGYGESKVVAWLGKKEIPVETAKQLFENLK